MAGLLEPIDVSGREGASMEISRQLLTYLLSGRVHPGQRLPPERKLAEMLGVGRSVVREALKSLTLLGLLEVRLGDGTYVKRTDAEVLPQTIEWGLVIGAAHVLDLDEARRHLEAILAGLAARHRDQAAIAALDALLREAKRDRGDTAAIRAAEAAVMRAIGDAADNDMLNSAVVTIRSLLQVWLARLPRSTERVKSVLEQLGAAVDAIRVGDAEAAQAAIGRYVGEDGDALRAILVVKPASPHVAGASPTTG